MAVEFRSVCLQMMAHGVTYCIRDHGEVFLATTVAGILLFIGGITYRVLARPPNGPPIVPNALEPFPLEFGDWIGEPAQMDPSIVQATSADALISRQYSRRNGSGNVSFYMACGIDVYELLGHRPESCYPGAGWTLLDRRALDLPLGDGTSLSCHILRFFHGGVDIRQVTVLNYFVMDGQVIDPSLLRLKTWRRFRSVAYAGQIQIIASGPALTEEFATHLVCSFAVDSAPSVAQILESIEEAQHPE